jgi:iron complex outermembrane receptor protein
VSHPGPGRLASALSPRARFHALAFFSALCLGAPAPVIAQTPPQPPDSRTTPLPPVDVITSPQPPQPARRSRPAATRSDQGAPAAVPPSTTTTQNQPVTTTSPLNTGAVATSASRLGLTVRETPATVEVLGHQQMRDQGIRTTAEAANGATGVLSVDVAAAPAGFSMRGFSFSEVNILYNGISTGPQSVTSRTMDTAALSQIEFLQGPSSLMSGLDAIGGSVNYVSRAPTSGPIRSELDLSLDSLGTARTHYGSGGSTKIEGLDYRFDVVGSHLEGFIDDVDRNLYNVAGQLNYRVNNEFKVFGAADYKRDDGHAYWGTPVVPTTFAGSHAINGVVSGFAVSTFDGSIIAPVTIDSRTLKTNYDVLDNSTGAEELWLRSGFEWTPSAALTVKNQIYYYQAKRHWVDSETYAFDTTTNATIDRDRFVVRHDQHLVGNNTDVAYESYLLGMENRSAAQLQLSSNRITFNQTDFGDPNGPPLFPADTVDVLNPDRGSLGPMPMQFRDKQLETAALSFEDRLKPTPWLALIGGLRYEHIMLDSSGVNFDGSIPPDVVFSKTWNPVSYRAAITVEPVRNLMLYAMTATAYDPAAATITSIKPGTSVELTSARLYEGGVKHLFWDERAEWTLSVYDITRKNVYVAVSGHTAALAGEIDTQGVELAAAVRPFDGSKLWANVALNHTRYADFDDFTGNTPSNVAPLIVNAGASYRWNQWRWPVELGGSLRHVGRRYVFEDDATAMEPFTTADLFAFIDIPGRDLGVSKVENTRIAFRVRNVTDRVYAAFSDPGYQDQIYLGAPRTYEVATSFRW